MKITGHRRHSLTRSFDDTRPGTASGDDETVVEPDQGNVLSHIISQLRPGADLSRVTLPTFILEPRSMLERITNFMAHPETLLPMPDIDDPLQRFVSVIRFYLSGWHIKPPGVKKPLNPILGEAFTGYWEYDDGSKGYYISEQTSHHPPKSSYFFMVPDHNIRIDGTLKPHSKFLGNSAVSVSEGIAVLRLLNRGTSPGGEKYFVTQPNMYARGILFGKMKYELGDHSYVKCPELNLSADIEFKVKGYFGGTYNAIGGTIKDDRTGKILYEVSGMWNREMEIKNVETGHKELLFNARNAKHSPPKVRPLEEQDERESQKLWLKTCIAIKNVDHAAATDEKAFIEERQREEAAKRLQNGEEWEPKLFRPAETGPGQREEGEDGLDWILDSEIDGKTPGEKANQILAFVPILPGQKLSEMPPRRPSTRTPAQSYSEIPKLQDESLTSSDLIDFGEDHHNGTAPKPDTSTTVHPTRPSQNNQALLLDLDDHPPAHSSHQGTNKPKGPAPVIRHDTETSDTEEFVDAQEDSLI